MAFPELLEDIALRFVRSDALSIYEVQDEERRVSSSGRVVRLWDVTRSSGRDNLRQAIEIRLLTPKGELAALGHPEYGSRLPELVGQPNTETTQNLAKLFVIEALKQERRIQKIISVDVSAAQTSDCSARSSKVTAALPPPVPTTVDGSDTAMHRSVDSPPPRGTSDTAADPSATSTA